MIARFARRSSRSVAFWTIFGLAFASQAVLAGIIIKLTTAAFWTSEDYDTALAATIMDILAQFSLLAAVGMRRLSSLNGRTALCALSVVIVFAAVILSIIVLSLTLQDAERDESYDLAIAGLVFCVVATVAQTVFHGYLLWPQRKSSVAESGPAMTVQRSSPVRSIKRSITTRLGTWTPTPQQIYKTEPHSPTDSGYGTNPGSTFKATKRPASSRIRLMRHSNVSSETPSVLSSTRPPSSDAGRQDGFESWDTSGVIEMYHSSPSLPIGLTRLETIPGSRPGSPAKALDGSIGKGSEPVAESRATTAAGDGPSPELPPMSPISPTPETSSLRAFSNSRRPSIGQSHIHPLFRTESPVPPPTASPRTVIFASCQAGQVVSPETWVPRALHSTHGSRPGSTTPTGNRAGSIKSVRFHAASPEPPLTSPLAESSRTFGGGG